MLFRNAEGDKQPRKFKGYPKLLFIVVKYINFIVIAAVSSPSVMFLEAPSTGTHSCGISGFGVAECSEFNVHVSPTSTTLRA